MRCLLINPLGTDPKFACSPPLGLAYIAANLEEKGHEVRIIDRVALQYRNKNADLGELERITERQVLEFEPQLVGIGAVTIQAYDLHHVAKAVRRMHGGNNFPIVAGGFHPTAEPTLTLVDYPEIDIVCRGEGEQTVLELASGKKPESVSGLTFRRNGKLHETEDRAVSHDLDVIPFPARHLLDMDFYCHRNDMVISCIPLKVATILASRGCYFNCKFCSSKLIYKLPRYHSPEYVLREIETVLEDYPVEAISFVDSTMLPRRDRLERICEMLIEQKLNRKIKWGCSLRANLVDKKILELMREAGCIFVNYGFESGSQRMLDLMNKRVTVADNYRAVRLTSEVGIMVNSAMIVNLPGETEEDMSATIKFLEKTGDRIYSVGLNPLLPLPGSPYYREFVDKGLLKRSDGLWGEVGVLPKSIDQLRLYCRMPRSRFMELYKKADGIATRNNIRNYIRVNWRRHPVFLFGKAVQFLGDGGLVRMLPSLRIAQELLGVLVKRRLGETPSWDKPFDILRNRWGKVPVTPTARGRKSTDELLSLSDKELLKLWLEARDAQTVGKGFAVRGWYHLLYSEALRGKKVLDIGCGLAFDGITFAQHGARVTFVDIVETNIEVVRRLCKIFKLRDVDFLYMENVESLSSLDLDYDVVLGSGSLHNAPFDVMRVEVQELLKHLKIGGRWLQLAYPKTRWEREGKLPFDMWGVRTDGIGTPWAEWYDLLKLLELLEPAQFDVVLYLEFDNSNYNWFDLVRRR